MLDRAEAAGAPSAAGVDDATGQRVREQRQRLLPCAFPTECVAGAQPRAPSAVLWLGLALGSVGSALALLLEMSALRAGQAAHPPAIEQLCLAEWRRALAVLSVLATWGASDALCQAFAYWHIAAHAARAAAGRSGVAGAGDGCSAAAHPPVLADGPSAQSSLLPHQHDAICLATAGHEAGPPRERARGTEGEGEGGDVPLLLEGALHRGAEWRAGAGEEEDDGRRGADDAIAHGAGEEAAIAAAAAAERLVHGTDAAALGRAVGCFKLVQSLGWCIGFALSPPQRTPPHVQAAAVWLLTAAATLLLLLVPPHRPAPHGLGGLAAPQPVRSRALSPAGGSYAAIRCAGEGSGEGACASGDDGLRVQGALASGHSPPAPPAWLVQPPPYATESLPESRARQCR